MPGGSNAKRAGASNLRPPSKRARLREIEELIETVKQARYPGYEVYLEALTRRKERLGEYG